MFPQSKAPGAPQTLKEKTAIVIGIMQYPALTVMLFMRRKIGFRQLKASWLSAMTLLLMFLSLAGGSANQVSPFGGRSTSSYSFSLMLFALSMLAIGIVQRRMRWNDLCNGVRLHTRARGISHLSKLLPFSEPIVQRFIDPAACLLVGLAVSYTFSEGLGLWLMFSAVSLYMVEQYVYEQQLEVQLDILDGLVDSEVQTENVQHFEGPQPEQKERSLEQTAGIPTGIAPELETQIARRKKRTPPPDNLTGVASA